MNLTSISTLFILLTSIPVVMYYRVLPVEGTPYLLFGLLFISVLGLVGVTLIHKPTQWTRNLRTILFVGVIFISLFLPWVTSIVDRHRIAPVWGVHDIILQQEQAIRYLVRGKNPYKETYFGTPVEMFRYDELGEPATNPALYHFVMPPWYLVFSLPFYYVANRMFGYFDGRMVLIILAVGSSYFLWRLFRNASLKELAVSASLLSPGIVTYAMEGRSDGVAFFWLIGSLYFLQSKRHWLSLILFTFGCLTKQTIWFAAPFFLLYFYLAEGKRVTSVVKALCLMAGISVLVAGPFIVWDSFAFFDSVIFYLSGGGPTGYPVAGYGLSMILYEWGFIENTKAYYPFILWQIAFGLPTLLGMGYYCIKKPTISRFLIAYGFTLFSVWYTSRYFNNSHISVIALLLALGLLKRMDEEVKTEL